MSNQPDMFDPPSRGAATVHDFRTSLARSHSYSDAPWWFEVYRAAFPGLLTCADCHKDGWAQRAGIDRILTLDSGRVIKVDEKVRDKVWPDFLLERWSDKDRRTPGWVQKPLDCEFIAYAFVPSRECYLLPVLTLQRAWRRHGPKWVADYPIKHALNDGWVTENVAVPRAVVLAAMTDVMRVEWSAEAA